jgi:cytochrome c-type biogenesis protein CcsB
LFPKPNDPNQKWYAPGDDLSGFIGMDSMFVSTIFFWYLSEVQNALVSGNWSEADRVLDMITIYQTRQNNVPGLDFNRIALEVTFNNLQFNRWAQLAYLIFGGLLLILTFISLFGINPLRGWLVKGLGIAVFAVFLFHAVGIGMRWHIGGFAPFSNSFESMTFMAWASVLTGLLLFRRSPITFSLATLFAGIILYVTSLGWMNPQITPLVPVLQSPWMVYHVSTIIAAYGLFGIGFFLGVFNLLILRKEKLRGLVHELTTINQIVLIIGLILMTVGTFIGAVWANESWGRYWGWDPKETWSLITMVVYVIVTHLHLVRKWYSLWLFNLLAVIAFAAVVMTYFGVSFFNLGGLHVYV